MSGTRRISFACLFLGILGVLTSPWIWGSVLQKYSSYSSMEMMDASAQISCINVVISLIAIIVGIISFVKSKRVVPIALIGIILGAIGLLVGSFALFAIIFVGT